jgi:predicted transcriptional regulator of viral defense system
MTKDRKYVNPILRSIHVDKKEFVTSEEVRNIGKKFDVIPENAIRNLMASGYLVRIFRGLFYVPTFDEVNMGNSRYSHLELVARGFDFLGVRRWYFCLQTALKLNNMTHETASIDLVASDSIFRGKPIDIAGHQFKFHKLSPGLFDFGIRTDLAPLRFSDPEKTILDIVYINRYNAVPSTRIAMDVSEYIENANHRRIQKYLEHYPGSVRRTLEEFL